MQQSASFANADDARDPMAVSTGNLSGYYGRTRVSIRAWY